MPHLLEAAAKGPPDYEQVQPLLAGKAADCVPGIALQHCKGTGCSAAAWMLESDRIGCTRDIGAQKQEVQCAGVSMIEAM